MLEFIPKNLTYLVFMIALSLVVDFDLFMSTKHRETITHTLVFWGIIILLTIIIKPEFWIIAPPILCHVFLDTIDWGVMIFYPFSRKKYGLKALGARKANERSEFSVSLESYLSNRRLLYLEGILMIISVFLLGVLAYCF